MTIRFTKQEVLNLMLREAHDIYEKLGEDSENIVAYIFEEDDGDLVFEVQHDEFPEE